MKSKKINKIVITMGVLACVSGGLFAYQNFYLTKNNENEIIYLAKGDIPAMTSVTSEMFKPVSVPKNGVLPGYVTNINEIVGKELRGGLLADEPLSKSRLITNKDSKFDLEIKLESDISVPIKNNEYVNVYVILKDSQGKVEVRKVFDTKQIQVAGVGASATDISETIISVKVTEDELTSYYDARERGKVIIAKNNSLDAKTDITDKKYDPNSQEAQTAVKPSDKEEGDNAISVIEKKIEEGETLDTLAVKYKTTVNEIKKLNNGKSDFNVGENIVLPAN